MTNGRRVMSVAMAFCGASAFAGEMERSVYESFVRFVGDIPPVIRTTGLENYSSNRLDFALMNGLAMTRGGRIYLNWTGRLGVIAMRAMASETNKKRFANRKANEVLK